jgi:hypothetical protein
MVKPRKNGTSNSGRASRPTADLAGSRWRTRVSAVPHRSSKTRRMKRKNGGVLGLGAGWSVAGAGMRGEYTGEMAATAQW